MTCESCVKDISNAVHKLEGITKVEGSLRDQLVTIEGTGTVYICCCRYYMTAFFYLSMTYLGLLKPELRLLTDTFRASQRSPWLSCCPLCLPPFPVSRCV